MFLDYVSGKEVQQGEYIERLHRAVEKARCNETWRGEYMTYKDIERRGYLQRKDEEISVINEALSKNIISEDVAKQLLTMLEKEKKR